MLRSIICASMLIGIHNLYGSSDRTIIDDLMRGYQVNSVKIKIRYCKSSELTACIDSYTYTSHKRIDAQTCRVVDTYYHVQLPTYTSTTGELVTDRSKWNRLVRKNTYEQVEAITAGDITPTTLFPIQIDHTDRYISPIMREKVMLTQHFGVLSFQEKQDKDIQAAMALLSGFDQLKYRLFGGTLPDPYASL